MTRSVAPNRHWENLSLLDALRPEPGWRVEHALLATYSADPVVVVACLLALAGGGDDRGSGSKTDFTTACERLRDRVRVMVQAGRITVPGRRASILAVVDQFLREVPLDESVCSWHPKVALVRLELEDAQDGAQNVQYRLWLGSRNLTRDLSWDTGLLLIGEIKGQGVSVPGIAQAGEDLAHRAGLPGLEAQEVRRELDRVRWQAPPGMQIEDVRLLMPHQPRELPTAPSGLRSLLVVSPFLDGNTVKQLGSWGDLQTQRTLLSTRAELAKLALQAGQPLKYFQRLLTLEAPALEALGPASIHRPTNSPDGESKLPDSMDEASREADSEARGLHAKLIYAEHKAGRTLWVGSANATMRAWKGPNAEIIARLNVPDWVGEGLRALLDGACPVRHDQLEFIETADAQEDRLQEARKQVVARWDVTQQQRGGGGPVLRAGKRPHPQDEEVVLEVGLLGCDLVPWPRLPTRVQLPPAQPFQRTELVQLRLTLDDLSCTWLQRAPASPPFGEERDLHAFAHYLDPRSFLLWIRSLLTQDLVIENDDWDDDSAQGRVKTSTSGSGRSWSIGAPTLEEMLKTWSRDPQSLREAGRQVDRYLHLILQHKALRDESAQSAEELQLLAEFQETWHLVHDTLLR